MIPTNIFKCIWDNLTTISKIKTNHEICINVVVSNKLAYATIRTAYYSGKRPLGRPNTSSRHLILKYVSKMIHNVDHNGSFNTLAPIKLDELSWSYVIYILGSYDNKYTPEWDDSIPQSRFEKSS